MIPRRTVKLVNMVPQRTMEPVSVSPRRTVKLVNMVPQRTMEPVSEVPQRRSACFSWKCTSNPMHRNETGTQNRYQVQSA